MTMSFGRLIVSLMASMSSIELCSSPTMLSPKSFLTASPTEPGKRIEMYSPAFYAACTFGGILSCGLTHMTVTPLDLVKCNMQIHSYAFCLPSFAKKVIDAKAN